MVQENIILCLSKEQWLDRYLYIEVHKIFFCTFLIELYEWISKLENEQGRWMLDSPIVWTLELVRRLEASEYKIEHIVHNFLDWVLGGFVMEFVVDTSVNDSEAE